MDDTEVALAAADVAYASWIEPFQTARDQANAENEANQDAVAVRKYYKLTRVEEKIKVSGSKGQALDQAVEKYTRAELANLATVKSGDLVEIGQEKVSGPFFSADKLL